MTMHHVQVLNASDSQKTLTLLRKAMAKAKGKTQAALRGLYEGLGGDATPNPPPARRRFRKEAVMAHKRKATARKKRHVSHKHKTNPTPIVRHASHNPTAVASHGASRSHDHANLDFKGLALEAATVAGGALITSFAERQAENFLPDMNPAIRSLASGLAVAGGAYLLLGKGGKGNLAKGLIVGSLAETVRNLGRNFAPGIFAGTEDELSGVWDPATGEYIGEEMSGLTYALNGSIPSLPLRPVGV